MSVSVRHLSRFSQQEITLLRKHARRIARHAYFHILLAPAQLSYGRILIIISRKVGSAPQRNLLRRRLKAIFYEEQLFTRGHDVVIIAQPGSTAMSFAELQLLLAASCGQA